MVCSLTLKHFFSKEVVGDVNMDSDMKLLFVENRNHVWRDLSRLVDSE